VSRSVEVVEKVPKRILGRDGKKSDLTECTTISGLMLEKGQASPGDILIVKMTFSAGSLEYIKK
jgi:hypothetical protein